MAFNTNLNASVAIPYTAPPAPPADPHKSEAADAPKARDPHEHDFEKALQEAVERNRKAPVMPTTLPWMLNQQVQQPTGDEEEQSAIEAASGVGSLATAAWTRPVVPVMPRSTDTKAVDDGAFDVAPVKEKPTDDVAPVQVLVEPGLPPVQPVENKSEPATPVHVADFPQVVTGTVRQMVKDNQPITQLDFEISPPHIGPVNLQVSLQGSAVNVQLVALTLQAKQALESQISSISSILSAHSFTPGQIKVVTAASGKSGSGAAGQKGEQGGFNFFSGGRRKSAAEQESISVGQA